MPPMDGEFEDAISSGASEDGAASGNDVSADLTAASGSSPEKGEEDTDLLSVVRDVVNESRGKSDAASPAEGEEGADAAEDDEDYSDVPFDRHPRFKQVVKERREFKRELEALRREIEPMRAEFEPLREDAGRYRSVIGFLDQAGLSEGEAADMLLIGGLMKTNPVEAWARMKPTIQNLLIAAGEVIPDDLQQRVASGQLPRDAAIEIARARAAQASVQRQQSFQEQRAQRVAATETVQARQRAAADWEADRVRKDPNFAAKLPDIQREVVYLQRTEGVPNTPEGVKEQLAKAYKTVNDRVRPAQTAPQAKRPVTGGQVAGTARPAEMSTLDIVRAGRRA